MFFHYSTQSPRTRSMAFWYVAWVRDQEREREFHPKYRKCWSQRHRSRCHVTARAFKPAPQKRDYFTEKERKKKLKTRMKMALLHTQRIRRERFPAANVTVR